jgi:transcriptional regulator with XRE-family HTH domain
MSAEPVPLAGPPAEAVLIKRARQARGLSPEDAAAKTTVIKSRRWRQIEAGRDGDRPATGEDHVIAHMAAVVGVEPALLARAGRAEAAEVLREIGRQAAADAPPDQLAISPDEMPQVRAFLEGLRQGSGTGDDPGEIRAECEHERRILRGPGPAGVKRMQIEAHRLEGHDSFCDPDDGVPLGPRAASTVGA